MTLPNVRVFRSSISLSGTRVLWVYESAVTRLSILLDGDWRKSQISAVPRHWFFWRFSLSIHTCGNGVQGRIRFFDSGVRLAMLNFSEELVHLILEWLIPLHVQAPGPN